ncbi:MAG: PTS sugar transporter subunit IIC [Armatimonadetes bacterium]|nr:PTS sugar transporter subunit IIC [Armatimonadota bacterium]
MKSWDRVLEALARMARQRHMLALRDGMIAALPVILIGSTFLLLGAQKDVLTRYFPGLAGSGVGQWYLAHTAQILIPYRLTMGMLSIYMAFTMGASLARQYDLPPLPQGIGAVVVFLLSTVPSRIPIEPGGAPTWVIPLPSLGPEALFLSILCGLLTVEASRVFIKKTTKEPSLEGGVPQAVTDAFASFLPVLLAASVMWGLRHLVGFDVQKMLISALKPMETLGDSMGCVVLVNVALHVFGVAGVHGISVINAVFLALWQKFLAENAAAHLAGASIPYITAYPFYQWFIWAGGAGITLPVPFILLFSRSGHLRKIGRFGLIPSLFNVNEPILFGVPIVANPILAIPFVLAPVTAGIISFVAVSAGLVGRPFIEVPWVLPCFIGAPLATQDLRSLVLLGINLGVSTMIWLPFLKAHERKLMTNEDS